MKRINLLLIGCFFISILLATSCTKLIQIDPPATTITTAETFSDSLNAASAISGVYSAMQNGGPDFMNSNLTIYPGESADELVPYLSSGDRFYSNALSDNDGNLASNRFWQSAYTYMYQTNAIIEGVQASDGVSQSAKAFFIGEAKFLRALNYFYLVNLYGDVPYIVSTDYHANAIARKTPKASIYVSMISDLQEGVNQLPADYSISGGDRTRANKWAAAALLARVYLYTGDWPKAEATAGLLINNTALFGLNPDLTKVFFNQASGNKEAILQWALNPNTGAYNATWEGYILQPSSAPNNSPNYYINNQLLNAFEAGDQRRVFWLDSTIYGSPSATFYFPAKYKIGAVQAEPGASQTEYPTVLRLAEQFLIRAEARAQQNKLTEATADLNAVRERAGLTDLNSSLNQSQVLSAVTQERRIELFAEWGNRWFDLKRSGQIDSVMRIATPLKGQGTVWKSYQQLYPIALSELQNDPNLTNNQGY